MHTPTHSRTRRAAAGPTAHLARVLDGLADGGEVRQLEAGEPAPEEGGCTCAGPGGGGREG